MTEVLLILVGVGLGLSAWFVIRLADWVEWEHIRQAGRERIEREFR